MLVLLGNSLAPRLRDHFNQQSREHGMFAILPANIGKYPATDAKSEIKDPPAPHSLKGSPVTVIQSIAAVDGHTSNDFAMQLLFTIRTLKRNGAGPMWGILPFTAYSRQDRAFDGGMTSIGIDDFAFYLKQGGFDGISTVDMHSQAGIQYFQSHFGEKSVYNLDPSSIFVRHIAETLDTNNLSVGGPDAGAHVRAENVADSLHAKGFHFRKQHTGVSETEVTSFVGDVTDGNTATIDDMIDTGGTIRNAQSTLEGHGAKRRLVCAAHGLFNNNGLERLFTAKAADGVTPLITELVVTDTVDMSDKLDALRRQYGEDDVAQRIKQVSVGALLHEHIVQDIMRHPSMQPQPQ